MIHQWRIVFERSYGAVLVHAADGEDGDAKAGIPEDNWRYCDNKWFLGYAGVCKVDDTLRVNGELQSI